MVDSPVGWCILFAVGIGTGVLSGLLGIGGGLVMVPVLTFFGLSTLQATATSLVGVLLSSVSGSIRNLSVGQLNWQVSLIMATFGIFTAQLGAWIGSHTSDTLMSVAFAGFLLFAIYSLQLKQIKREKQLLYRGHRLIPRDTLGERELFYLYRGYQLVLLDIPAIAFIGLTSGFLSGLFGVGGGIVMVPLQMLFLKEAIKTAVRTSLGAMVAIAISGLAQHTLHGNVLWIPGFCLGIGGVLGAQFGSRLLPRLADRTVHRLFRTFLFSLSVYMIARTISR